MLPLAMDYLVARVAGTGGAIICLAAIIALLGVAAQPLPGTIDKLCWWIALVVAVVGVVVASASGFVAIWTSDTLTYVLKAIISGGGVAIFSIPFGIAYLVFEDNDRMQAARLFSFLGYLMLVLGLLVCVLAGLGAVWLN